ncbi:uncharacterized protein LOC117890553 [Drosophila subobscura]|uniref:uncharacterized protein LOC117890553 n=1 Tax=Drosophila subobscura TaxID=7241 RepID=UPI00155ABE42|nr:uncharacterized protein LOC117890553 [Drosophila subobscura]
MKTANKSALWLLCLPLVLLLACSLCGTEARSRPCTDDRIVFPRDNDSDAAANSPVPAWIVTTAATSTTTAKDSTEQTTEDSSLNGTATTITPIIVNRILVDTLPRCKSGFELRANRCRKSA